MAASERQRAAASAIHCVRQQQRPVGRQSARL